MIYRPQKAKTGSFIWIFSLLMGSVTLLVLGLSVWTAWGISTLHYDVTPTQVIITFGPTVVEIDRDQIEKASIIERPTRGRRIMGTSMPGLKQGRWSFQETGRITLYATTTESLVVIETPDRKWGISPADAQSLLSALERGTPGTFEPVGVSATSGVAFLFIIACFTLVTTVGVGLYVLRLSRNIRYELGSDALRIHGSWRPIEIPYKAIDAVSIESPDGMPLRVWGTGMPGLHWGAYSWKALGPSLRLYGTRLKPLVVVRTDQRTYGLTPEDDAGFVDELKRMIKKG